MHNLATEVIDFQNKPNHPIIIDQFGHEGVELFVPLPKLLYSERSVREINGVTRHRLIKNVKEGIYPPPRRIGSKKAAWTYQDLKVLNLLKHEKLNHDTYIEDIESDFYSEITVKEIDVCIILDVSRMTLRTNSAFPRPSHNKWIYADLVKFTMELPKVQWRDMQSQLGLQ